MTSKGRDFCITVNVTRIIEKFGTRVKHVKVSFIFFFLFAVTFYPAIYRIVLRRQTESVLLLITLNKNLLQIFNRFNVIVGKTSTVEERYFIIQVADSLISFVKLCFREDLEEKESKLSIVICISCKLDNPQALDSRRKQKTRGKI